MSPSTIREQLERWVIEEPAGDGLFRRVPLMEYVERAIGEASSALLAQLERDVEGLLDPRHGGPPLADDLIERAAVLDVVRKAGRK